MRAVVLHHGKDGFWVTEVPSPPGRISQGETLVEAIADVKEAIDGWIETPSAHGPFLFLLSRQRRR